MSADRVYGYMIIAAEERANWIALCRGEQAINAGRAKAEADRIQASIPPSHDIDMKYTEFRSEYAPPGPAFWEEKAAGDRAAREIESQQRHAAIHHDRMARGPDRDRERG